MVELQLKFRILPEAGSGHERRSHHAAHANQNTPTRTAHAFPHKQDARKLILYCSYDTTVKYQTLYQGA
jgi:hypothetical protein